MLSRGGSKDASYQLQGGELYIFRDKKDQCWHFAKVLAAFPDAHVAFVRTYKQCFEAAPARVVFKELSVGSLDDPEGPTIGCAPIRYESIHAAWLSSPDYGVVPLSDEEIATVNETIRMMNEEP
jgi:hypothetical protein